MLGVLVGGRTTTVRNEFEWGTNFTGHPTRVDARSERGTEAVAKERAGDVAGGRNRPTTQNGSEPSISWVPQ